MKMPFGKFKGWLITAVDDEYLRWLRGLDLREPLRGGVEAEWRRRFGDVPAQSVPPQSALPEAVRTLVGEIVSEGVRIITTRISAVGSDEEMASLHQAVELLKRAVEDGQLATAGTR